MVPLEPPGADFEALLLAVVLFVPTQLADWREMWYRVPFLVEELAARIRGWLAG